MDVSLGFDLVVVREAVHFVYKHLEVDLWVDSVGPGHSEVKPAQSFHIIILSRKKQQMHILNNSCFFFLMNHDANNKYVTQLSVIMPITANLTMLYCPFIATKDGLQ